MQPLEDSQSLSTRELGKTATSISAGKVVLFNPLTLSPRIEFLPFHRKNVYHSVAHVQQVGVQLLSLPMTRVRFAINCTHVYVANVLYECRYMIIIKIVIKIVVFVFSI